MKAFIVVSKHKQAIVTENRKHLLDFIYPQAKSLTFCQKTRPILRETARISDFGKEKRFLQIMLALKSNALPCYV
jgi:hypothetical protein